MGSRVQCFLLTPTDRVLRSLRRFRYSSRDLPQEGCPLMPGEHSYHDVGVPLDEVDITPYLTERGHWGVDTAFPHDDPRWPKQCACGYLFTPDDVWQCRIQRLYRRSDEGDLVTLWNAPAGALWWAEWLDGHGSIHW